MRLTRRRGWVAYRTLIVGTGPTAARVKRTLDEHPEHGLRVVGFMGPQLENAHAVQEDILEEDPVELAAVTVEHDVAVVIITYVGVGSADVLRALRMRDPQTRYTLFLVPPLFQMLHSPRRERIRDVGADPAAAGAVAAAAVAAQAAHGPRRSRCSPSRCSPRSWR